MRKDIRNGYVIVDAAIFLPICLIALLTIGFFIKVVGNVETSMHVIADETRVMSAKAYSGIYPALFKGKVEDRILKSTSHVNDVRLQNMRYLSDDGEISFNVKYHVNLNLPFDFWDGMDVKEKILARGWIGKSGGTPFGFDAMEREEDSNTVYIFPESGKKYHKKSCTYVTANPTRVTLTSSLKRRYKSCPLCKSGNLPIGSIVYCFTKYGDSYHRGNCKAIEKYTVTMEKSQAESRGYTPCSKCGGI